MADRICPSRVPKKLASLASKFGRYVTIGNEKSAEEMALEAIVCIDKYAHETMKESNLEKQWKDMQEGQLSIQDFLRLKTNDKWLNRILEQVQDENTSNPIVAIREKIADAVIWHCHLQNDNELRACIIHVSRNTSIKKSTPSKKSQTQANKTEYKLNDVVKVNLGAFTPTYLPSAQV